MYVIAFVGQKGGTGKSTLAIATACELLERGQRVLLIDADPQGSSRVFADVAQEQGRPVPTVVAMGAGLHRPDQLPALAGAYDVAVIDCPPSTGPVQRSALMAADLAVIPAGASPVEVWALGGTIAMVREAQELREDLRVALVVNRKDARSVLGRSGRASLEATGLPVLATEVALRVAFAEAPAAGQGVTVYAPGSEAAGEVRGLVDEILGILEPAKAQGRVARG